MSRATLHESDMAFVIQWHGRRYHISIVLLASAKSRSMRGASHHLTYMGSCLTISHMLALPT